MSKSFVDTYRDLAVGDNDGNTISYKVWRASGGLEWHIRYNGRIVLQGWEGGRRSDVENACRAKIQRFIQTDTWAP